MTTPRLKMLVIENFRSLRGKVVIPLDAQVVLIHGTNGMGKTSTLSALELGLTGRIAHLAAEGNGYRPYLTTLGTGGGSIELTTTAPQHAGARTGGSLAFSDTRFESTPLLDPGDAHFFSERCYLPQATLGRLLEIYGDQKTTTTSPLTQFVKELLGLDPLDALVDGLQPARHVARIRNLVPQYRRLEALFGSLKEEVSRIDQSIATVEQSSAERLAELNNTLGQLSPESRRVVGADTNLAALRAELEAQRDEELLLTDLARTRSELNGLSERWRSVPTEAASHDVAGKERRQQTAIDALNAWRTGPGNELETAVDIVRSIFSDVQAVDDGPETSRATAERRADAEATRCTTLLNRSASAAERVTVLNATIQRASTRIDELDQALASSAQDAKSLASALAGVASHVRDEVCPMCNRDFAELDAGPLAAHIATKIASLTSEAGRLQAMANERAEESNRLTAARRDLLSAPSDVLSAEEQEKLRARAAQMASAAQRLKALADAAETGTRLMAEAMDARDALMRARRREELSTSLLPEIKTLIQTLIDRPASSFVGIDEALKEGDRILAERIESAERIVSLRVRALSQLELLTKDLDQIIALTAERTQMADRLRTVEQAIEQVNQYRERAKKIADAADKVRSSIVKRVFNTSLNKIWRDLFVRLAPSEQFVPAFKLPTGDGGTVEAVLETLHRSGTSSGSPGAMLSHGNLNTAALTLFLALHLSVPMRMPWLVLDDPVQSMDDVHIAQFAALLRTLSKGLERQLIVAVHERALFDYLTLELSPAFPGDSLMSIEITRNFEGDAVAASRAFGFEEDRAIAA